MSLAAFAACASACTTEPAPLGEALVVVQTDVAVPLRVSRMRVEIMRTGGEVIETREVVTPSAQDWPVSFSVVLPDGVADGEVLVRLRAYPEGHELASREVEQLARIPERNPIVHASLEEACKNAPALKLATPMTLRRGSKPITSLIRAGGCIDETLSGSAIARLDVVEPGDYRIAITRGVPNSANAEPGSDTALSLRKECTLGTTQIACAEHISATNRLSRIERVTLTPGTYWVVTGGSDPAPADLTIVASRLDVFQSAPAPPPPLTSDATSVEPSPGVAIDRLFGVKIRAGVRGHVPVVLRGECFGTPADLAAKTSCIDVNGRRDPLEIEEPRAPFARVAPEVAPWAGDRSVPCNGAPRDGEICVPGAAFVLGDTLALEDLEHRAQPERMRVVAPFFLDRLEVSVGRYRAALASGFKAPDMTPLANAEPGLAPARYAGVCTWSEAPLDREAMPLNCVSWSTAHALCNFFGGELPTEDQWELAATAAGRDVETPYPWGRDVPTCDRTVFGRTAQPTSQCASAPLGPLAVDDPLLVVGDVTPLGIVGLGGNVAELLATPFIPYSDPAWARAGLRGTVEEPEAPLRSARGADWSVGVIFATASTRRSEPVSAAYNNVGFRCARSAR